MDPEDLRLFVEVARHASFTEGARRTGTPTSTVSRAVMRLERALGVRLLQRTSRKVTTTSEGAHLLERASPLIEQLDTLAEEITSHREQPAGRLRVTAPMVSGREQIGPTLAAFAAAHPATFVELHLSNAVVDLVEEGFDLGFRAGPVTQRELVARRLWSVPFAFAAAPSFVEHALGGRTRLDRTQLETVPAVVIRPGARWRLRGKRGAAIEIRPREHFSVNDHALMIEAARHGVGLVCLPRSLIERAGRSLVSLSSTVGEPEPRELFAVYPSRRLLSQRVRLAIDWVAKHAAPRGSTSASGR